MEPLPTPVELEALREHFTAVRDEAGACIEVYPDVEADEDALPLGQPVLTRCPPGPLYSPTNEDCDSHLDVSRPWESYNPVPVALLIENDDPILAGTVCPRYEGFGQEIDQVKGLAPAWRFQSGDMYRIHPEEILFLNLRVTTQSDHSGHPCLVPYYPKKPLVVPPRAHKLTTEAEHTAAVAAERKSRGDAAQELIATETEYNDTVRELRDVNETVRQLRGEHNAVLLELIRRRVVTRPKKIKKAKKAQPLGGGGPKKRRRKAKTPAPEWLSKDATLDDLVAVLEMDQKTDEIYVDVSNADAPYDTLTLPMVRHFIRKARTYPSMCSEWNTVALMHDDERVSIPMNGRSASRCNGAAGDRAYAAMDALADKLGFGDQITTNVLKDCGYGSKKAAQFRTQWRADRGLGVATNDEDEDESISIE